MSFFQRNTQTRNKRKRPEEPKKSKKESLKNGDITSESDEGMSDKEAEDHSESEDENETAQEKRLRLAKTYLDEISRAEKERAESKDFDSEELVKQRLKEDYLEQIGRLHRTVADSLKGLDTNNVKVLRCKEHRDSVISIAITSDNKYIYSGSKDGSIVIWSLDNYSKVKSLPFRRKEKKSSPVFSLALSDDGRYVVYGEENKIIIRNQLSLEYNQSLDRHKGAVTGLVFRKGSSHLYSASLDRSIKVWSVDEMMYIDTMFGHQSGITSIDALSRERAITSGGHDSTLRVWKIADDSQLIYNGHNTSIDCVKLINEDHFVSGGDDGQLCVWGTMKKKPLCIIKAAHGVNEENKQPYWITAIAALLNSDVIASGSSNGCIKIWKICDSYKKVELKFEVPIVGCVNNLCFTSDGSKLIAAVGREHRFGRWWCDKNAKNSVVVFPFLNQNVET